MSLGDPIREAALLRFIAGYLRAHDGVSPSFRECVDGVGVRSKNTVSQLLFALEHDGLIRRLPGRQRAIELLCEVPIPIIGDVPLFAVPADRSRRDGRQAFWERPT